MKRNDQSIVTNEGVNKGRKITLEKKLKGMSPTNNTILEKNYEKIAYLGLCSNWFYNSIYYICSLGEIQFRESHRSAVGPVRNPPPRPGWTGYEIIG